MQSPNFHAQIWWMKVPRRVEVAAVALACFLRDNVLCPLSPGLREGRDSRADGQREKGQARWLVPSGTFLFT